MLYFMNVLLFNSSAFPTYMYWKIQYPHCLWLPQNQINRLMKILQLAYLRPLAKMHSKSVSSSVMLKRSGSDTHKTQMY